MIKKPCNYKCIIFVYIYKIEKNIKYILEIYLTKINIFRIRKF